MMGVLALWWVLAVCLLEWQLASGRYDLMWVLALLVELMGAGELGGGD